MTEGSGTAPRQFEQLSPAIGSVALPMRDWRLDGAALVIFVAVALAYVNSLGGPFLLDDRLSIVENPSLRSGPWSVSAFFPPEWSFTTGRPILNWSFAFDAGTGRIDPSRFRCTNVLLHAFNALLFARLTALVLRLCGSRLQTGVSPDWVGLSCGLLWAANPLHTAAVTYVSQRAEVLMATFHMCAVWSFLRGLGSPRPWAWRLLTSGAFLAGVMTKESVLVAPLVCWVLVSAVASTGSRPVIRRASWLDYAAFTPGLFFLVFFAISTALTSRLAIENTSWIGLLHLEMQVRTLGEYLRVVVWPHPLVFDRGPLTTHAALAAYPLWRGVLVLIFGAASGWALLRGRTVGLPVVLFLILLAPTTSFIPVLGQPIADHRLYLPLCSLCAGVTVLVARLSPRGFHWTMGSVGVILLALTFNRNLVFQSVEGLWTDTVAKAPLNHRAVGSLAQELLGKPSRRGEAIHLLRRALSIEPRDAETHYLLGVALLAEGKSDEAEGFFLQCSVLNPQHDLAYAQSAALLLQKGKYAEALPLVERAVLLRGDRPELQILLGTVLRFIPGRLPEALGILEGVAKTVPENPDVWIQLGLALANIPNERSRSIEALTRATALDHRRAAAWRALGSVLAVTAGREAEAQACFERAIKIETGAN